MSLNQNNLQETNKVSTSIKYPRQKEYVTFINIYALIKDHENQWKQNPIELKKEIDRTTIIDLILQCPTFNNW